MKQIEKIIVVGGGTAGWLTACVLASEFRDEHGAPSMGISLIESPDIPILGVGEGTWPSMRTTLEKIGLPESEFLTHCLASFKQGTLFEDWQFDGHRYIHPFTPPARKDTIDLGAAWDASRNPLPFGVATCPTASLAMTDKAPKKITTPEYAFSANYGYHLDAGAFADLLTRHGVSNLGVQHIPTRIQGPKFDEAGYITALQTETGALIEGDLFIDCSGSQALLLGQHLNTPFISKSDILFNDAALAVQVSHLTEDAPIASSTRSTAQSNGWIWDIALQHRRGIGYVHCTAFIDESEAETELRRYIAKEFGEKTADSIQPRKLKFQPGYRTSFWEKNCIAIGMSSGFIEPLEASALVMVETSAWLLARSVPRCREDIELSAKPFNQALLHHWDRIIHFLKLHYVLSEREGAYWEAHRNSSSWPGSLAEDVSKWRQRPIDHGEADRITDLFPAASYQYVYHGMGKPVGSDGRSRRTQQQLAQVAPQLFNDVQKAQQALFTAMPSNRELLDKIKAFGQPRI